MQTRRPRLPSKMPDGAPWPKETRSWYAKWSGLTPLQYDELLIAAVLHGMIMRGDAHASLASELRKRVDVLAMTASRSTNATTHQPVARRPDRDLRLVEGV